MKQSKSYALVAAAGLVLFFTQEMLHLKMRWLENLQANDNYKILTGGLLAALVAWLWSLSIQRFRGRIHEAVSSYQTHKKLGALAPFLFYIHSTDFGYAYLRFFSAVFFFNTLIGILNKEIVNIHKKWFTYGWMILHVTLSVLLVVLMFYHIFIVFSYR